MHLDCLSGIIAVLVAFFTSTATARWAVNCQAVLRDRIDPVHHPGELANAFNLFAGSNAVNETVTYDELRRSTCSSCSTTGDMSLYWTSQLFFFDGNNYMFVPDNSITVHYDQSCPAVHKSNTTALPFPEGFQMSAGHISKRHPASDVPDGAIRFECHDKKAPNGVRSTTATLPQEFCPDGLSAKIGFPSCWDGKTISSSDGSHVAYPVNGACASSHPKRLVSMWYEILYDLKSFKGKLGVDGRSNLVFAQKGLIGYDNDPTGYGFQGVFMNGWDTGLLQRAILNCNDQSNSANNTCSRVLKQVVRSSDFVSCAGTQHAPEAITAPASPTPTPSSPPSIPSQIATPGFQTTSLATRYTSDKPTASTLVISTSSASSVTARPSSDPAESQEGHWELLGCGADYVSNRTWTDAWVDSGVSQLTCTTRCSSIGMPWAGLENGNECFCSHTAPSNDRLPRAGVEGHCDSMPCEGDVDEPCGGDPTKDKYVLSMYYWCKTGDQDCSAPGLSKRDVEHSKRATVDLHPEFASFEEVSKEFPAIIERVTLTTGDFIGIKVCTPSTSPHQAPHCILIESYHAQFLGDKFLQWARETEGIEWHEYGTLWEQVKPLHDHHKLSNIGKLQLGLWVILSIVPFFVGAFAFLLGLFVGETYAYNPPNVFVMEQE
ncbi:hypothetical protein HDK77DRAFT_265505 [Phyllosticta capitalensis]